MVDWDIVWETFHSLWSKAVGEKEYDKKQWCRLQEILEALERKFDV